MKRDGKGTSVKEYISNYCIVDLETTGIFVNSADIIEIAVLRVRDNEVVDEFNTLINPHCHIPEEATAVNNITDDMVKNAPDLSEVIDDFCSFIGNDVIVGYNNAAFDMNVLYDNLLRLRDSFLTNDYIDILHSARRCLTDIPNYKLETVSKYYGLDTQGEHRALKDCYLTKACYDKLYEEYGNEAFYRGSKTYKTHRNQFSVETIALQELHHFLEDILEDGNITHNEFFDLKNWIENHRDLQGNYPFDRVFYALDKVLNDGKVTPEELEELQQLFMEYVDPVKSLVSHEEITDIYNKHICVTGDFNYGTRNEVFALIEKSGGIIDKNVKKSTDFVVVGSKGSENWKTGNYGSKIQKAMEYNENGSKITIIEEDNFIPFINRLSSKDNELSEISTNEMDIDYKNKIQHTLDELILQYGLLPNSLLICENLSKDKKRITSYSISIYEREYPQINISITDSTRNSTVLNFKIKEDSFELIVGNNQFKNVACPATATIKQLSSDTLNVHIMFSGFSEELVDYIKNNTKYALEHYVSKASSFGCCSLYEKCSNAKKCLHENLLYSKACQYRKNLENGKIFYGVNNT